MTTPTETIENTGATNEDVSGDAPGTEQPPQDDAPPVRRARGRPRKDGSTAPTKETPSGSAPRRGRPPKSGTKKVYSVDEITLLGKQLVGIHAMASMMTQIPEAAISDPEGLMMAQSIVNLADQYDLELDGKTGAAIQLLATAAMIYAPRVIAVKRRMAAEQANTSTQPQVM